MLSGGSGGVVFKVGLNGCKASEVLGPQHALAAFSASSFDRHKHLHAYSSSSHDEDTRSSGGPYVHTSNIYLKTSPHCHASSFGHYPTQNRQSLQSSSCLRRQNDSRRTGGLARQQTFASSHLETTKCRRIESLGLWCWCSILPTTYPVLPQSGQMQQIRCKYPWWLESIASPGSSTMRAQISISRLINCSTVSSGMCKLALYFRLFEVIHKNCIPWSSQISNLTVGTYNVLIHSVVPMDWTNMLKPTRDFWEIFLLYRYNVYRSSAVIPFDGTGTTNSLPLAIFNAPITSSAASVANFPVLVFFSSKGMHCSIPRMEMKNPRSCHCLSKNYFPLPLLKDDI